MRPATNFICRSLTALVILTTGPAQAKTSTTLNLAPAGSWNINYDADVCQLARTFGSGKDEVLFQLLTYDMQPTYTAFLVGNAFALKRPIVNDSSSQKAKHKYLGAKQADKFKGKFSFQFGPSGRPQLSSPDGATIQMGKNPTPVPALIASGLQLAGEPEPDNDADGTTAEKLRPAEPTLEAATSWFLVRNREGDAVKLSTGNLAQPLAALRACSVDLVKSWGIAVDDPALAPVTFPRPKSSPGTWATSRDFPASAMKAHANAKINFRLMVDAKGKITDCKIQDQTKNTDFSKITCSLMRARGSFDPALNAAGQPVAGYYTNAIRWVMTQ